MKSLVAVMLALLVCGAIVWAIPKVEDPKFPCEETTWDTSDTSRLSQPPTPIVDLSDMLKRIEALEQWRESQIESIYIPVDGNIGRNTCPNQPLDISGVTKNALDVDAAGELSADLREIDFLHLQADNVTSITFDVIEKEMIVFDIEGQVLRVADSVIKDLAESGRICEVLGHYWDYVWAIYDNNIVGRHPEQIHSKGIAYKRKCQICGKTETCELTDWK